MSEDPQGLGRVYEGGERAEVGVHVGRVDVSGDTQVAENTEVMENVRTEKAGGEDEKMRAA
jgi:hypothetical protein